MRQVRMENQEKKNIKSKNKLINKKIIKKKKTVKAFDYLNNK